MVKTVLYHAPDMQDEALKVIELADAARKNGVLSLQNYLDGREFNPYLVRAINLAIDGSDASDIERVMSQDIISMAERHRRGISIFRKSAEVAPGMGLIGTLIGLVQMLDKLEDPSSIGPAMAVALLTTLYGAILSFMFFSPLASKLERNSRDEAVIKNIYLQGAISIARVENPRNLQELLNTILPPAKRVQYFG
jgi:chemotaxis protein MotA